MQRLPNSSIRALVYWASCFSFKYTITISAPSLANKIAIALPIPLSPPEISTTLFFNLLEGI